MSPLRRFGLVAAALLALVGIVTATTATVARAERRVALVVGNAAYRHISSLDNATNDARLVAEALRSVGFTLVGNGPQLDVGKAALDSAVQEFGRRLQGADVGLFYYAGHGVQVRGANYLVPIEANPVREADVEFQMLDTAAVLRQMEAAGTRLNLVVLDACRNNPFGGRGLRSTAGGLAQMQAPEGTLISFATQPGNVAIDGSDGNSPYTKALARTIRRPGLGLFDVFNAVGLEVKRATGGSQQPWVSSSPIEGAFYFVAPGAPQTPAPAPAPAPVVAPAVASAPARPPTGTTTTPAPVFPEIRLEPGDLKVLNEKQADKTIHARVGAAHIASSTGRCFVFTDMKTRGGRVILYVQDYVLSGDSKPTYAEVSVVFQGPKVVKSSIVSGRRTFPLLVRDNTAWLQDQREEAELLQGIARGEATDIAFDVADNANARVTVDVTAFRKAIMGKPRYCRI
jgi:hypothetical protein